MKHAAGKYILIAVLIGAAVLVVVEVWKAWQAGTRAIADLLLAPWNAVKTIWSGVSAAAGSVAATAKNVAAGNAAAAQINALNNSAYAPGGMTYNSILASQGQAAADAAWQTVQQHQATQAAQTVTWNPLTWL